MTMFTCCKRLEVRPNIMVTGAEPSSPHCNISGEPHITDMSAELSKLSEIQASTLRKTGTSTVNINLTIGNVKSSESATEQPGIEANLNKGSIANGLLGGVVNVAKRLLPCR